MTNVKLPSGFPRTFQKRLLDWYGTHKRALPWRLHHNPYGTFVSEVMLQQTQVKTVIPYYERWLKTFPTIKDLARSPLDRVLKLWEGLGYYTRARNLHRAAKIVVRKYGGKIPRDPETLQTLPGIGRYTAGAIASIAFRKPVSLVDGNILRVFSRLFNLRDDISKPQTHKKFYQIADRLIPEKNPGTFNQALMELGSLVCFPDVPDCPACPVKSLCLARRNGNPLKLPFRGKGAPVKKIEMVVGLLAHKDRLLIRRRPAHGIWGGLWEIPGTIRQNGMGREETLLKEFEEKLGFSIQIQKKDRPIEHRLTHRAATIYPFHLTTAAVNPVPEPSGSFPTDSPQEEAWFWPTTWGYLKSPGEGRGVANSPTPQIPRNVRWASPADLKRASFPVPHQKILKALRYG